MMTTATPTILMLLEGPIWIPGEEWRRAVEHLAIRFRRVRPLEADAVLAVDSVAEQMAALEAWRSGTDIDLDRELGRFLDEHLSMHMRPAAHVTRTVRHLASRATVVAASALPPRAAESIARHTGVWRSFDSLVHLDGAAGAGQHAVDAAARDLGAEIVISSAEELAAQSPSSS